jgi:C4-dicarboxylate-specific signal transduction histidine kinase
VARLSTIGEMAAELAHELNQPLAAISNYAGGCVRRLQADSGEPRELIAALEEITLQANRASEILKGIRNFARKREAQRALVDINAYVSAVASRAAFAARKHQVTIQFELNDALPLVAADGIQLEQVLLNLLLNGFEAMHDVDESRRQLHIRTAATAEQLIEVTVTDHGHGFPPEIAEDIFHPFFTTKPEGLGMGLSISRSIVEAHGGKLTAVLNHDHGATFRFTLPCPVAEQPVDECDT